jgi:two-component system, OmpR family, phosphate regulon sensor histidine kinase PhoR
MTDRAELLARIEALERESRRAFEDAQREADALFAQYQLSQLVASGGSLADLARSVALEAVRLAAVDGGALWLGAPDGPGLTLLAAVGADPPAPVPADLERLDDGRVWATGLRGGRPVVVSDDRPMILLCFWADDRRPPEPDGIRVIQLARHELAVAFQGARLREELEREREELTAVVSGTTDLILQVDADRRVVRLNPAGERLLGVTAADALGRTCREVLGCDVAGGHDASACPIAEVMATGRPVAYRETEVRGPDGASIRVAGGYSTAAPTSSEAGDPVARARATAILRDISAVRALEELREGFVATVSHELRTPLSLIRGYTETLLHLELEPGEQRDYLERIDEVTERLSALVGQILDITHLQADPLILERAPVLLASLVSRLRGDLETSGRADRLVLALPADLPPVEVDGPRVGQILENIVGNAFKYGPPEGLVTLSAALEGEWLTVAIDDEGVGIPASERALVTEPFHRAWNVRESRIPGTGLGLFISRRLVEAHGGRLRVEDRPDGRPGTRVAFTLPLLRGRSASTGRPAPSPAPAEAARG